MICNMVPMELLMDWGTHFISLLGDDVFLG
jgi:hypothetical protein